MDHEPRVGKVEQADGSSRIASHGALKRKKARSERRRAKKNPECAPAYNIFHGYET